jgi:hydroxyethylthiazole kinase-like uncharacterized protein yjeF
MSGVRSGLGLELLTPGEMAEADRQAAGMMASIALMEAAGRAVARAVVHAFAPCRVLVLAGPGNNGGDGYVAARVLAGRGWPVAVAALAPPRAGSDAAVSARRWRGPVVAFARAEVERAGLVIDAVFGAGLARAVEPMVAEVLGAARRVVAVDVPSGVDGATGAALGAVRGAELTVTFVRLKPGHLLDPGRRLCGRVALAPIGMPGAVLERIGEEAMLWRNEPPMWPLRAAGPADHKYSRGTVGVVGGASMGGAALLAANAARRAGAGLVRLAALWGVAPFRGCAPGLIVDEGPLGAMLEDERRHVWVCGPGLSVDEAGACLPALLGGGRLVVADGGALGACAGDPARLRGAAVLTPHAGEFARVFGAPGVDRVGAARAAARLTGAVVAMKGSDTIVASPDGRAVINVHATSALATAGTGDTLAGVVGAMLANGMKAFEAASAAVWLHGEAGRLAGDGLIAEDLADRLPAALASARRVAGGVA